MGLVDNIINHCSRAKLSNEKKIAFKSFLNHGFPTTKNEEWKYTSLKNVIKPQYKLEACNNSSITNSTIKKYSLDFKNIIVFLDGNLLSFPKISGVKITDFTNFKGPSSNDAVNNLNFALAKCGYTINVSKDTVIDDPIIILFFNSTKNSFFQYRNLINIEKSSQVKIVERIVDLTNTKNLTSSHTQVNCDQNSNLEFNKIQNNTNDSSLIDQMNVYQKSNSLCEVNTLIFGGGFIRNNLNFEQNGENCESNMNGISLLNNNQFADNHTFVDHKKPNCRSNENYKGIYLDSSKGVFNGKIMVRKNAQKIDAFQSNNNLLMSQNSTIDSKPQLEIYADDVKCSHGCTIGQLDNDALFYMRTRGIKVEEAKAVLTYAFASEVIDKISITEIKKLSKDLLTKKLNVTLDISI